MSAKKTRRARRRIRAIRIRKKIKGSAIRPRLNVFRSNRHIYAQLIDDEKGHTLVSVTTEGGELKDELSGKKKVDQAAIVGKLVGERAKAVGIGRAIFDRSGNKYHGRVKALCEAAREAGLEI